MRALRMEWTKLRTVTTTHWWLLGLVALTVGLAAVAAATSNAVECAPRCDFDVPRLSLSGVYIGQIPAVALGALVVTAEYDTMMVRATLAAYPRRGAVLAAKLAVATLWCSASPRSACSGRWRPPGASCPATVSPAPTATPRSPSANRRRSGPTPAPCCTSASSRCSPPGWAPSCATRPPRSARCWDCCTCCRSCCCSCAPAPGNTRCTGTPPCPLACPSR